ncbi:hypothetical protein [Hymenobacter convexus]|uniref:hypothetical protein n=1 Tax=Hymenobacter sp. CA1UV-4 TaxID=3063782 RepID=UPI0027139146|nr:hypothetical protein [Hymenobacter sp. CA1UV-4]MDO7852980.1 hypothetical protein [Hymenobacter sp. CA1UV-4]
MKTHKLSYEEYQETFAAPMLDVSQTAEPVLDIWPYVEAVPESDLEGFNLLDGIVRYVYQSPSGQYLHVSVSTDDENAFLVLVIDLHLVKIIGHYLLDLVTLYDLNSTEEI